jgi:arginyl-tRNA synthetase
MNNSEQNLSQAEAEVFKQITETFTKAFTKNFSAELIEIDYTPIGQQGDFSVSCFMLAKKMKKSPVDVAADLVKKFVQDHTSITPQNLEPSKYKKKNQAVQASEE